MIGLESCTTSTRPAHCRSIFSRAKIGNISMRPETTISITGQIAALRIGGIEVEAAAE